MLMSAGWLGVVLLIVGATMVTHEYDFRKTIFTCISTLMNGLRTVLGAAVVALTGTGDHSSGSSHGSDPPYVVLKQHEGAESCYAL